MSTTAPLITFWTLRTRDGRLLTCAVYRVPSGLELRLEDERHRIASSELFRGADKHLAMVKKADIMRARLVAHGSSDVNDQRA